MSDDCGCCTTISAGVPGEIQNRPGLSAVAYRIGTFATFRQAILDELSRTPALRNLTTRTSDDYTITAIELWSAVADVLTFYQERIANESFLRTAGLRDSVLRLVRLVDYQLHPGSAATTQLAFTLEAGASALIPARTRVQSVPGEGEKPQKFETLAPVLADARLNRLRLFPPPAAATPLAKGTASSIVAPDAEAIATGAALVPGDHVLLYATDAIEVLTVRRVAGQDDMLVVDWAAPIASDKFETASDASLPGVRAYKLGRSFRLFGHDAAEVVVVAEERTAVPPTPVKLFLTKAITDYSLHPGGIDLDKFALDARYAGLKEGATVLLVSTDTLPPTTIPYKITAAVDRTVTRSATTASGASIVNANALVTQLTLESLISPAPALPGDVRDVVVYELLGAPLRFSPVAHAGVLASKEVYLPGRRAGWSSIELGRTIDKGVVKPGIVVDVADLPARRPVLLTDGKGGEPVSATIEGALLVGSHVELAATATDTATIRQLGLAADQATPVTILLSRKLGATVGLLKSRPRLAITIGALPSQTIELDASTLAGGAIAAVASALENAIRAARPGSPTFALASVWVIDEAIAIAPGIPGDRVAVGPTPEDTETVIAWGLESSQARFLDGVLSAAIDFPAATTVTGSVLVTIGLDAPKSCTVGPAAGTPAALAPAIATGCGLQTRATAGDRILVLPPPPAIEPRSFIRLKLSVDTPLALDAATAVLLGNVAPASHGETIRDEILGDGDASRPFQHFSLKKKPVTYVSTVTSGGAATSLEVFVDGSKWSERPSLYGASPRDQVYVTRIADDGALTVQFGDGETGARPPTGRQNISARYRQGTGDAGRVRAGTLSTLLDRPTGVKSVTSPRAADGGADPETMAGARDAAPGTVRTFGRAVSRRDFEDTALMNGEVAKSSATWVWTGVHRAIHLTIAGREGAAFSKDGLNRIAASLAAVRDPNHKLLIDNYTPVAVVVDAALIVDDRYDAGQVLAAARAALLDALSFASRAFAEPVYLSDVYRVLQDVAGVVAVDVNRLDLKRKDTAFRLDHGVDDTIPQPQARLLMLPARLSATAGAVWPAELARVEVPAQDITLTAIGGIVP